MTKPTGANAIIQKLMDARDKEHLDPRERANLINTFLFNALGLDSPKDVIKHPLYWDLTCFCTEFLNLFALQTEDKKLMTSTIQTNNWIYTFHYTVDESAALGPSREEHIELWQGRIHSVSAPLDEGTQEESKVDNPKEDIGNGDV